MQDLRGAASVVTYADWFLRFIKKRTKVSPLRAVSKSVLSWYDLCRDLGAGGWLPSGDEVIGNT
jgi:hypothetical protein